MPCKGFTRLFFHFDNIEVEVIQPADDAPSIWRECLDRDGEGLHHISFAVKNMAENLARWGYRYAGPTKGEYPNGRYAYLDTLSNLKVILEFLEGDALSVDLQLERRRGKWERSF